MSRAKWMRHAAAAAVILLGTAAQGYGAPVLQDDFSQDAPGRRGGRIVNLRDGFAYQGPGGSSATAGSYVEYDLRGTPFNPARGTIELDVTRAEKEPDEALFSFADKTGERLFTFYVQWTGGGGYVRPTSVLLRPMVVDGEYAWQSPGTYESRKVVWPWADLGNTIPKGKTVHIAMTWNADQIEIFVDGKVPDGKSNPGADVAAALRSAAKLVIGGQTSTRIPGGAWSMTQSLLANVQLHDRVLAPGELAQAIPPKGPNVYGFEHDASRVAGFSGKLIAGDRLGVTLHGTPGMGGSFDIVHYPDIYGRIDLDWRGWGVYLEEKVFYGEGEVNLRDVKEYEVYAAPAPFDLAAPGFEPLARLKVTEQKYLLEAAEVDKPYYVAVVALMNDGTRRAVVSPIANRPLTETEPGVYTGSYLVTYQDRYPRAVAVARFGQGAATTTFVNTNAFAVDPSVTLAVTASPDELRADEKSTSTVTVVATNANGNPVAGHKIRFFLATTSQYTGVVGGGAFAEQVGGGIKEDSWGETDLFGKVTVTYVAGFAAKTAVIVARDMASDDTGAGWVKTYIQASAQLELEPAEEPLAAADGYEISVTSSDEWLTADGKSQARITAKVTRFGKPVEGHKVGFDVASGTGSIRVVKDVTGADGEARAVYTAGKKIGMVLITATDYTVDISGSVQIELRSDAPAKITIQIKPEKIPADGRSSAELLVLVTDVNDNPNDNTEVEYAISEGTGRLKADTTVTDKNGETTNEFIAGRTPGRVTIGLTVRSLVPTDEELLKARGLALAVADPGFF